ncbi:MAG: hypothetical protein QNJ31_09470 [Candidatus Caenarcaniphilales bacterium]|nr:hypothetical protein [Candidatus Caenarcaniphilales bacterium]
MSAYNDILRLYGQRDATYKNLQGDLSLYSALQSGSIRTKDPNAIADLTVDIARLSQESQNTNLQIGLAEKYLKLEQEETKKIIDLFA